MALIGKVEPPDPIFAKPDVPKDESKVPFELNFQIAKKESGTAGFGYDSIFIPAGQERTIAELGLAYKNQSSHRFLAAEKMLQKLTELGL